MVTQWVVLFSLATTSLAAPLLNDTGLLTPDYFQVVDKNGDGKINFDEFLHTDQAYINKMMQKFARLDTDGSDSLDVKEFITLAEDYKNRYSIDLEKESGEDEPVIVIRKYERDEMRELPTSDTDDSLEDIINDKNSESNEDLELIRTSDHSVSAQVFEEYDEDHNGRLNESELLEYIQDFLEMAVKRSAHVIIERYDADRDGGLDTAELAHFTAALPGDLVEPLAGSEEYDYVHDGDDNDYGFASDLIVSDHH